MWANMPLPRRSGDAKGIGSLVVTKLGSGRYEIADSETGESRQGRSVDMRTYLGRYQKHGSFEPAD